MVAAAVEPFVVGGGVRRSGEGGHAAQDLLGVGRVQADRRELLVGQLSGLVEDRVRDRRACRCRAAAGAVSVAQSPARSPSCSPISAGEARDAARVAGRERRLRVDHVGERLATRSRPPRRATRRSSARLQRAAPARSVVAHEVAPEPVVGADREERRRRPRVEPARRCARAPFGAAAGPWVARKTSAVCARQAIRASSGISSPGRRYGWPPPSQCSSSARTASAVAVGKPSLRRSSAPRSQRVSTIACPRPRARAARRACAARARCAPPRRDVPAV